MDTQRDAEPFRRKLAGLCEAMGKPLTDELLETWWKALRHCDFAVVAGKMDRFAGNANDTTKFPRPAQMRPVDATPPTPGEDQRNWIRDYWRNHVVACCLYWFARPPSLMEQLIIERKESLGRALRQIIDDMEALERRDGRSTSQLRLAQQRVGRIARDYADLRSPNAPPLPEIETEFA